MAFSYRAYLDGVAVWRRWKMHPTWVPGVYSRFVPRKAWVRRLNKFLGVFHFLWNSGFARLCGLRDVHVLPDADEPRRGLPHEEVRGRAEALPPGMRLQGGSQLRGKHRQDQSFRVRPRLRSARCARGHSPALRVDSRQSFGIQRQGPVLNATSI